MILFKSSCLLWTIKCSTLTWLYSRKPLDRATSVKSMVPFYRINKLQNNKSTWKSISLFTLRTPQFLTTAWYELTYTGQESSLWSSTNRYLVDSHTNRTRELCSKPRHNITTLLSKPYAWYKRKTETYCRWISRHFSIKHRPMITTAYRSRICSSANDPMRVSRNLHYYQLPSARFIPGFLSVNVANVKMFCSTHFCTRSFYHNSYMLEKFLLKL